MWAMSGAAYLDDAGGDAIDSDPLMGVLHSKGLPRFADQPEATAGREMLMLDTILDTIQYQSEATAGRDNSARSVARRAVLG